MSTKTALDIGRVIAEDGRYHPAAFELLHYGLRAATERSYGDRSVEGPRHVSGQELCEGIRAVAQERWGLLAPVVLETWGVRNTRDFGEMVYLLVRHGAIGKQDDDRIEDFDDVFDFSLAFSADFSDFDNA